MVHGLAAKVFVTKPGCHVANSSMNQVVKYGGSLPGAGTFQYPLLYLIASSVCVIEISFGTDFSKQAQHSSAQAGHWMLSYCWN